jgi:4-amino-4-deoxy-L-arabinose transferase-like glycosyltransferase
MRSARLLGGRQSWLSFAALTLVCGWFCLWHLGAVSFIDPDEGMYGGIARAIAETGDWITPRFDGIRYLNKPPLLFWLSALTFNIFGPSEWGVRLWSALPALGSALLVSVIGTYLYGGIGGIFSALIFASSLGTFLYSHMTLTDPLLVFSLTLAMTAAVNALSAGERSAHEQRNTAHPALLFYLSLGIGALSKGLPAVLLPAAILGLFGFLNLSSGKILYRALVANRYAAMGIALWLLIVAPWHVLAARANPGFARYYLLDNHFLRFATGKSLIEDDVSVTTPMFLVLSLFWFLPWSLLLPAALTRSWIKLKAVGGDRDLLPVLWAFVVLAFFSISSSKLEDYALPALPAFSLLVGGWWAERLKVQEPRSMQWPAVALLIFALLATALFHWGPKLTVSELFSLSTIMGYYRTIRSQGFDFPLSAGPLADILVRAGLTLLLGIAAATWLMTFARARAAFAALLVTSAGLFFLLFRLVVILEPYHSSKLLAEALKNRAAAADLILHEDPLEYSGGLAYYTGRRIYIVNGRRGSLEFGSRYPDAKEIFLDDDGFVKLWGRDKKVFFVTRLPADRSVVRLLSHDGVVFLGQYGARRLYANRE